MKLRHECLVIMDRISRDTAKLQNILETEGTFTRQYFENGDINYLISSVRMIEFRLFVNAHERPDDSPRVSEPNEWLKAKSRIEIPESIDNYRRWLLSEQKRVETLAAIKADGKARHDHWLSSSGKI